MLLQQSRHRSCDLLVAPERLELGERLVVFIRFRSLRPIRLLKIILVQFHIFLLLLMIQFLVLYMTLLIPFRLFPQVLLESLRQVDTRLVGEAEQHPQHIRHFIG